MSLRSDAFVAVAVVVSTPYCLESRGREGQWNKCFGQDTLLTII